MWGLLYGLGFAILLVGTCTLPAQDKGKKAGGPQNPPTAEETEVLRRAGEAVAQVLRVGTNRYIAVRIPYTKPDGKDKKGRPKFTTASKNVDLELAEDLQVRMLQPKIKFDDKGKPIPYTKDELTELKGSDPKLPGYTADATDLREGQTVRLYFKQATKSSEGSPTSEPKLQVGLILVVVDGLAPQRPMNNNYKKK